MKKAKFIVTSKVYQLDATCPYCGITNGCEVFEEEKEDSVVFTCKACHKDFLINL